VLTDVAAAAGLSVAGCLAAASEEWRDDELVGSAQMFRSLGVTRLPVVSVGDRWFDGVRELGQAAAWARSVAG
jgi:predicted DsbA family dithiol-disulfide isomerase